MIEAPELDDGSLDRLLDAVYEQYHYDFRSYARTHLRRRVGRALAVLGAASPADLAERIRGEPATFPVLLRHLTIPVSDLFRDPPYFRVLRERVVPHLATYPFPRIWVAGCGGGEEAYSMAILLLEEGLLDRARIYATDIDADSLAVAESATYDLERARGFSENYFRAGGRASLSDYVSTAGRGIRFSAALRRHVLFSDHCLATDAAFAEVHLVSCRNVLIYFERPLQDRAIGLFREALCPRGFLGLGAKETITFSRHVAAFEPFAAAERIHRVR